MLKPTYARRARQLVKNGRAAWVSTDTIRLTRLPEEVEQMEQVNENGAVSLKTEAPIMDDKAILDLAKRRLAVKRGLAWQLFDYLIIILFALLLIGLYHKEEKILVSIIFLGFWGVRLTARLIRFMKPSFREGIAAYFRNRKKHILESEYERLRKLNAESLAAELNNR